MTDRLYIVVSKGPSPATARPLVVTEDPDLCSRLASVIVEALRSEGATARARVLRFTDEDVR